MHHSQHCGTTACESPTACALAGRLAAKEAMLARLHATMSALHEQHTSLTQVVTFEHCVRCNLLVCRRVKLLLWHKLYGLPPHIAKTTSAVPATRCPNGDLMVASGRATDAVVSTTKWLITTCMQSVVESAASARGMTSAAAAKAASLQDAHASVVRLTEQMNGMEARCVELSSHLTDEKAARQVAALRLSVIMLDVAESAIVLDIVPNATLAVHEQGSQTTEEWSSLCCSN